jgi:hypothetical protein
MEKHINGCWECGDFPCDNDMFDTATHDVKIRACARCIKEDGAGKFIDYIIRNEGSGIKYGFRKDYDRMQDEEAVFNLLRMGIKKI